ncbi:hypothetical protein BCR37DRAFT_383695 [Protomyces lactucae-debilis]|uniref:Uncharacterized protein n=1 Tax=Protomyces lactucae-debilis TaxID=2754530 RepID=A0A1Y2EWY6_PROLT|nr:uncharacterized protein BCR37DRAFT_383695 [Protomyces lactucae-debilis]ORY76078.1 hypothetical protein BCR37DRAFT_383695 [Protomyces lactucae-debilis]
MLICSHILYAAEQMFLLLSTSCIILHLCLAVKLARPTLQGDSSDFGQELIDFVTRLDRLELRVDRLCDKAR